jgi:hypothetical protein
MFNTTVSTGTMNYNFGGDEMGLYILYQDASKQAIAADISIEDGKYLNINNIDGTAIMNITNTDKLQIVYSLQDGGNSKNIALSTINKDLEVVSITLNPNSVESKYTGTILSKEEINGLLPTNLGTYKVHHSFDGTTGVIDLIPISLPAKPVTTIKVVGLSDTEMESNNKITVDPNTEQTSSQLTEHAKGQSAEIMSEDKEEVTMIVEVADTKEKEKDTEKQTDKVKNSDAKDAKDTLAYEVSTEIIDTIEISGDYFFRIPLNYDQYNAK